MQNNNRPSCHTCKFSYKSPLIEKDRKSLELKARYLESKKAFAALPKWKQFLFFWRFPRLSRKDEIGIAFAETRNETVVCREAMRSRCNTYAAIKEDWEWCSLYQPKEQ